MWLVYQTILDRMDGRMRDTAPPREGALEVTVLQTNQSTMCMYALQNNVWDVQQTSQHPSRHLHVYRMRATIITWEIDTQLK
jgi:hypothetical protein